MRLDEELRLKEHIVFGHGNSEKEKRRKLVCSAAGWLEFCGNVEHFKNADVSAYLAAYGSLLTEICYCNLRIMISQGTHYSS